MEESIIALAKAAIFVALNQPDDFNLTQARATFPQLNEQGAVFVTLRTTPNDKLRGCIGSLTAYRPLYKDIIFNAQAAAFKDPRFKPLKKEELAFIKVEVSHLSSPKPLHYKDKKDLETKIAPFIHGVVLKEGKNQATYLPSVWEELPKFDDFFSSLCLKAGLQQNCLTSHPEILIYTATQYKEK